MKKMYRVLAMVLVGLLLLSGCGDDGSSRDRDKQGNRIKGSVDVSFAPADENVTPTAEQLEAVKAIIEKRLIAQNISDYEAYVDVTNGQVDFRIPWANTSQYAKTMIKNLTRTGMVLFYEGNQTVAGADGYSSPVGTLVLDGDDILSAEATYMQVSETGTNPECVIALTLNDSGTKAFAAATTRLAAGGGKMSIWLDLGAAWAEENNMGRYQLLQEPDVNEPITGGEAIITGFIDYESAKDIADLIMAGSLPFGIAVKKLSIYP